MADKQLEFSPEIIDITWELAHLANRAFDEQHTASNQLKAIEEVVKQKLPGISYDEEVNNKLWLQEFHSKTYFKSIVGLIDQQVMRDAGSPFRLAVSEPDVNVDSIETSTQKGLTKSEVNAFFDLELYKNYQEQMTFNKKFWGLLGYEVPELSPKKSEELSEFIAVNPYMRLLAAPLLNINQRRDLAKGLLNLSATPLTNSFAALKIGRKPDIYDKLLKDPSGTTSDPYGSYALKYISPRDRKNIVESETFAAELLRMGMAELSSDGVIWVYNCIDTESYSVEPPSGNKPDTIKSVNPTVTPEMLIALQMLHIVDGAQDSNFGPVLANELVVQVTDLQGSIEPKVIRIAHVGWSKLSRKIVLGCTDLTQDEDKLRGILTA